MFIVCCVCGSCGRQCVELCVVRDVLCGVVLCTVCGVLCVLWASCGVLCGCLLGLLWWFVWGRFGSCFLWVWSVWCVPLCVDCVVCVHVCWSVGCRYVFRLCIVRVRVWLVSVFFAWMVCCVGDGFDVIWLGGLLLVVSCGIVG